MTNALLLRLLLLPALTGTDAVEPAASFGFGGLEIFRASHESVGLAAVDLDRDGRNDLVYADNADATMRLLYQVPPGAAPGQADGRAATAQSQSRRSLNEVPSDARFRMERFYTEKKVSSLQVGDFDGDGKPDLAYYGDPAELEVVYQQGEWGSRREKFPITDGEDGPEALAAADLDSDGRTDLVLLGAGKTYLFRQRTGGGGLERQQTIYNAFPDVAALLVGDLDSSGKKDLVLLQPRAAHPFLVRFQREGGFGPEIPVKSLPLHRAQLGDLGGPVALLALQGNTRRVRVLRWSSSGKSHPQALSEPRLYAFRPEGDPALRRVCLADASGDGRIDLLVSSPETAELDVYLQSQRGELSAPAPSPTLAEVKAISIGDIDGDGQPETVVASAREKALGVSRWLPAGRLSIPESHAVDGEPLLVAVERLRGAGARAAGAAAAAGEGAGAAQLALVYKGADGKFHLDVRSYTAGKGFEVLGDHAFEAGAEPNGLSVFDADGDGRADFLIFIPYDDPRLYLQEGGDDFKVREVSREKDFGLGQVSRLAPPAFTLAAPPADLPGHRGRTLLVAQKSFARALVLEQPGKLRVVDQYAGRGASAEISAAALLDLDADPDKEVLLYDRAESAIHILDRSAQGTYSPVRSVSMPGIEFGGFRILDLNGDGREDAVCLGKQAVAVLYQGGGDGDLEEFARYDLEDEALRRGEARGLPDRMAVGDFNADGTPDLVFSTEPLYLLGLLSPESKTVEGPLRLRMAFPIFEEKSYMRRQGGQGPREILPAEMTGDGKVDLVLLVHDRILLYPQE